MGASGLPGKRVDPKRAGSTMAKDGDAGAVRPGERRFEALVRFDDADAAAVLTESLEPDCTGDLRKEGIVLSAADVSAGVNSRAALAHDDRTGGDELAGKTLYTEPLTMTVATILGAAYTFFMSHVSLPPSCRIR